MMRPLLTLLGALNVLVAGVVLQACPSPAPAPAPSPTDAPPPPPSPPSSSCASACAALAQAGCTEGRDEGCATSLAAIERRQLVTEKDSGRPLTCADLAAARTPADVLALGAGCTLADAAR